jgi:multiple sugar transport system permease protein
MGRWWLVRPGGASAPAGCGRNEKENENENENEQGRRDQPIRSPQSVIRNQAPAWLFLTPNLVGFLLFTLLPVGAAVLLSLFDWNLFAPPRFVGLANFADLLGFRREGAQWTANDPRFWKFAGNTLFLMLAIPVNVAASLGLALLLHRGGSGRVFFRTLYFLPTICMGVGVYVLWQWLLNPEAGPVNWLLSRVGIPGPGWLKSYEWAKPGLMLMGLWAGAGGTNMVLYLAGLQGVPPELLEAATIDGAGAGARFRHVTWPFLAPTTFFIAVMSLIHGFQGGFDAAYIMTRGGPDGATTTISYYIFQHGFRWFHMGYAAAIAVVLFVLILGFTALTWRFGGRSQWA